MKNLKYFLTLMLISVSAFAANINDEDIVVVEDEIIVEEVKPKIKLVDKIVVRVNGVNILRSDLKKIRISKSGVPFNLNEAILDELLFQKAAQRKILPTELEVEKQIVSLKINNGLSDLTDEQFEEELKNEGFSLRDYKNQLARMLSVEKLKHAEFSERVVVTSQEVEEYYKENPIKIEEKFLLQMCEVAKKNIDQDGKIKNKVDLKWEDLGWIATADLSNNLKFVSSMKEGQMSKPRKFGSEYQMIKLVEKQSESVKKLDDCYMEIERMLHFQKKSVFEKDFQKELLDKAIIVYLT